MKSLIFAICMLVSAAAASANLRFTFVATDGTVVVNSANLNAAQEALLIDWLWAYYAPKDDVEGSPTFGQTLPRTPANEAQAYRNYARALASGTYAQVRKWKQEQDRAVIGEPSLPAE